MVPLMTAMLLRLSQCQSATSLEFSSKLRRQGVVDADSLAKAKPASISIHFWHTDTEHYLYRAHGLMRSLCFLVTELQMLSLNIC